jgi:hypothetical protein
MRKVDPFDLTPVYDVGIFDWISIWAKVVVLVGLSIWIGWFVL